MGQLQAVVEFGDEREVESGFWGKIELVFFMLVLLTVNLRCININPEGVLSSDGSGSR